MKSTGKEKASGTEKGKGKKKAPQPEPEDVEPEDAGCEVTSDDKKSIMLMSSYKGLCPLM